MNRHFYTLLLLSFFPLLLLADPADSVAIERLKQEISRLRVRPASVRQAWAYKELGDRYDHRFGYNKFSLDAYEKALTVFQTLGDSAHYYDMHTLIGSYYTHDGFMQADTRRYLQQALGFYRRQGNIAGMLECRLGIAGTQIDRISRPVLVAELHAIERLSRRHHQPYFQAMAVNQLASYYLQHQRWDSARHYAAASLTLADEQRIPWLIRLNQFYLGLERQYQGQPRQAIGFFRQAINSGEDPVNVSALKDIGRHLADVYAAVGDYRQAFDHARRVVDYTNTFFNSEETKNIRLQELNLRIRNLEIEKKLVEQQRQHQSLINSLLVAGLIMAVLAVLGLALLRRQQVLISRQKDVISRQQIRQLELKSLRALIDGQERERSRIARDLHDGLGAQLSRIKLFVESHARQLETAIRRPLNQFIDEACQETRQIANNLRPHTLSAFGLITALEDLTNKLNQINRTRVLFEYYGDLPTIDDECSVMLYRVIQELLSNALKHADSSTITLQCMANDESLLLSVDDNGRGFDPSQIGDGNGIMNIRSRIDYLGGQVIWHSDIGVGTSVLVSLPMRCVNPIRRASAEPVMA